MVRRVACDLTGSGAGADDGWIDVRGFPTKQIGVSIETLGATTIEFQIEARIFLGSGSSSSDPNRVYPLLPPVPLSAVSGQIIGIIEEIDQIRIGVRESAGTGVDAVTVLFDSF